MSVVALPQGTMPFLPELSLLNSAVPLTSASTLLDSLQIFAAFADPGVKDKVINTAKNSKKSFFILKHVEIFLWKNFDSLLKIKNFKLKIRNMCLQRDSNSQRQVRSLL